MEENFTSSSPSSGLSSSVTYITYMIFDILSILCSLFVLYYLLSDRALRRALNNHIIIVLLFLGITYELTTISWDLYYLRNGIPWIESPIFYLFSFFLDYGLYVTQIVLFAWATIERHILIFHNQWITTKKQRFYVHYLPIIIILIYCLIYFSLITFAPFCEDSFEAYITGGVFIPCVFMGTILGTLDLLIHQVIPTIIIVIFSVGLIVRVLWQKRKRNQLLQWRKHRKMTIQLLSISILYLTFNSPWTILIFASQYGLSDDIVAIPMVYAVYFRSYVLFLFPFVCCGSLSELRGKVKNVFYRRRRNQIGAIESLKIAPTTHK
ncbi:unnamed protein product [Adineta steineri]|uniref:G-protein coupled receptors family 1 profile domain-containing protein n=1 Tax=Adineta steineri TaxID=433720 RepID=A0A814SXD2_9BILA|nr:unnamed protein product [Adineta steineri]CAF1160889.1 unnamed protein product [Adineta steineri]CAF3667845.1 unnamed protein product [Adineta steineri]CAF3845201.1 unnamed protein product [Adineta steineri]